jgi:chromosome segregation protein
MPMYLKRLELQGYKTFAARTEFEFDSGITAIVGPNGSGKSNVADALRWVMGEQRYSTLRAKRSEDMIFAGSQGRASVGMADVSLTLDNSNGWLPIEYSEVKVQRRSFRSGENQYYLNGSRVRLRDIVELLAKGGVSSNTYTIIGQGAVDASLVMRPEERRGIFEEAAGIAIYQAKRDQSLAKLEDTRSNILRVNDIINEIAPRLKSLGKQARRAEEYQGVSRELEKALETWYGYRWRRAQEQLERSESDGKNRQEALERGKRELEKLSQRIDELRRRETELRGELGRWHSESGQLHSQLEELQRELAVKRERKRLLIQQRDEIQQDVSPLMESRKGRLQRIGELEAELERLATDREASEAQAEGLRREITDLEEERDRLERELATAQDRAFQLATELAEGRNRVAQLAERKGELDSESAEHEEGIEGLQDQLDKLVDQVAKLENARDTIAARSEVLNAEDEEKQAAAQASQERQAELRTRLDEVREASNRLETRYELLSKLRRDLTGYSQGVRTVLSHKQDLRGIVASVAELIEAPPQFERAIEAALGNHLQAVVVETWEDAEAALRFLAESDGGQAVLVPLDSLRLSAPEHVSGGKGLLGVASELAGIGEDLEDVLQALLGHTLVVEDLPTARSLHQRHPAMQIVTLDGQLVSRRGFLRGGAAESEAGLLAREREWRRLPEQIDALTADKEGLEAEVEREEQLHGNLLTQMANLKQEREELEGAIQAKEEEIRSSRLRTDRVSQEMEWHRIAQSKLQDEIGSLEEKEQGTQRQIEVAQAEDREMAEVIDSLQAQLAGLDIASLQGKLAELRTASAVLRRSTESQETALEGHRGSLELLESQIAGKESRIGELTGEVEELEGAVRALSARTEALAKQLEDLSTLIGPAEEELVTLEAEQHRLQKEEVEGRRGLHDYEAAYNKSLVERQRHEDELRNLQERIDGLA